MTEVRSCEYISVLRIKHFALAHHSCALHGCLTCLLGPHTDFQNVDECQACHTSAAIEKGKRVPLVLQSHRYELGTTIPARAYPRVKSQVKGIDEMATHCTASIFDLMDSTCRGAMVALIDRVKNVRPKNDDPPFLTILVLVLISSCS